MRRRWAALPAGTQFRDGIEASFRDGVRPLIENVTAVRAANRLTFSAVPWGQANSTTIFMMRSTARIE